MIVPSTEGRSLFAANAPGDTWASASALPFSAKHYPSAATWRSRGLQVAFKLSVPLARFIKPEQSQRLAIAALRTGLFTERAPATHEILRSEALGLTFSSPIVLAAGFDKNGEVIDALWGRGFGAVEVGTVTPKAQSGNTGVRLWRFPEDEAVVNRFGFNNRGLDALQRNIERRKLKDEGPLGINVGKNKSSASETDDFVTCIESVGALADYVVVNVSSPNTPGLRNLQAHSSMESLAHACVSARDRTAPNVPLLFKLAPDLSDLQLRDAAEVALASGLDGLIMGNTTTSRPPGLVGAQRVSEGGLSGRPLFALATDRLAALYRFTEGKIPIIGCGGVSSGRDAYKKIRSGASLVQLYSALVFKGPDLVEIIKRDLASLLQADGFSSASEAVGVDVR